MRRAGRGFCRVHQWRLKLKDLCSRHRLPVLGCVFIYDNRALFFRLKGYFRADAACFQAEGLLAI